MYLVWYFSSHHGTDEIQDGTHEKSAPTPGDEVKVGELAPHAASVLTKLLYAARIARFDLLRSINMLARDVTKWSKCDDIKLHHLMCYVNSTKGQKLIGWVGNELTALQIYGYLLMRIMRDVANLSDLHRGPT